MILSQEMSGLRAKVSSFSDSRSYCGGVVLDLLADRHSKLYKCLTVEEFRLVDSHLILVVRGLGDDNRNVYVVIILDKLPRAEIDNGSREGEPDVVASQFLERLSAGEVSELPGCLVLELKAPLVHLNIMKLSPAADTVDGRDEAAELTMLLLVDIYGCGNFFLFDNDLPYSRVHHKWSHLVTLDFEKGVMNSETDYDIVKFFDYNATTGEVVYCTGGNPTNITNTNDSIHMSSLRFQSRFSIEQSRAMTLGSYTNVKNVLCVAAGYWIVCADSKIHFYHYETCKVYSVNIQNEIDEVSSPFNMSGSIMSAVCTTEVASDINSAASLYILVHHSLFRVSWMHESERLLLNGVHRLHRVLDISNSPEDSATSVQDMHVAVEQSTNDTDTVIMCLASPSAISIVCLEYTPIRFGLRVVVRDARFCVTLAMPKYRSKLPARVYFVSPAAHGGPATELVNVCRNRCVFALTVAGPHKRAPKDANENFANDEESIWSDVEAQGHQRVQMLLALFPHLRKRSSTSSRQVDLSPYGEGEPAAPINSIHQHSILRDYLRHQKETERAEEESETGISGHREGLSVARSGDTVTVSPSVRALLQRLEKTEDVSLHALMLRASFEATPRTQLTIQGISEVLDILAEFVSADTKGAQSVDSSSTPHSSASTAGSGGSLAGWIAEIDLITLIPPPPSDFSICLAALGRSIDPILLLDLVQCLSPVLAESDEPDSADASVSPAYVASALYYDTVTCSGCARRDHLDQTLVFAEVAHDNAKAKVKALCLDIVLHLVLQQQPGKFNDILHSLLNIEYRQLCLLQKKSQDEPESPLLSLASAHVVQDPERSLPKVKSFRTSLGSATQGMPTPHHHNHQNQHGHHHQVHPEHEEDDDIFGLSRAVLQARHPPTQPSIDINALLHRNRLHGSRNISSTVFDQDGAPDDGDSGSDSDTGSENSDDMYGIFRDVSDENASERLHQGNISHKHSPGGMKGKQSVAARGMPLWAARECLKRAVQPLLSAQCALIDKTAPGNFSNRYVPLLDRCDIMARSYLDAYCLGTSQATLTSDASESLTRNRSLEHDGTQRVDALLRVLLLCHQPVLVTQYLVQLRLYDALVGFCQRLAASAAHLLDAAAEAGNAAVSTHPVARYIQAVGGARTSARFSAKQSQHSASTKWDAFLDELYALKENNLTETFSAVFAPLQTAPTTGTTAGVESVPTAAQVRLVEYIVTLKLTLRCLLARPDGFKDVVGTVLDLMENRPKIVPLDTMRAWITAFAADEAEKNRILLSGSFAR